MAATKIEWTETSWNPVTGCTKVSPGCLNCYAERMAARLQAIGNQNYRSGFRLATHEHMLQLPYSWKAPRTIFVNSMSDLFHEGVSLDFIQKVFAVMAENTRHTFQVLTKRVERLVEMTHALAWPSNVWLGVSIENANYVHRMEQLKKIPAAVRFVSCEPLIGPIGNVDLAGIHWVIAGGESGPGARTMQGAWAEQIRDMCVRQEIPFFFKQWGGVNKKKTGKKLGGKIWQELPVATMKHNVYGKRKETGAF